MSHYCSTCRGTGKKRCPRCGGEGTFTDGSTCCYCHGDGEVECNVCDGTGVIKDDD